jgi:peptidoglycan/xylan/chitin deacetylase (PgdA/CDA1 family)
LTIDDGICRQAEPERSMVGEVRELLLRHQAAATFMLCSDYVRGREGDAKKLLEDGHEFGNHCPKDREYASLSPEDFETELRQTSRELEALLPPGDGAKVRWFRAPQAKYTFSMHEAVKRNGMRHALADCYCDDFMNKDPSWVASTLLRQCSSGSIIIVHMPERGHWEHTFEALRLLLEGLDARGLRCVTLSKLAELAGPDDDAIGQRAKVTK